MRQRAGREGSCGGQYSQRRWQPCCYICHLLGCGRGLRGSQDVEGGRGRSWELRIDSVVQDCFLSPDLRNLGGLGLDGISGMSLAFSVFLLLVFVGCSKILHHSDLSPPAAFCLPLC